MTFTNTETGLEFTVDVVAHNATTPYQAHVHLSLKEAQVILSKIVLCHKFNLDSINAVYGNVTWQYPHSTDERLGQVVISPTEFWFEYETASNRRVRTESIRIEELRTAVATWSAPPKASDYTIAPHGINLLVRAAVVGAIKHADVLFGTILLLPNEVRAIYSAAQLVNPFRLLRVELDIEGVGFYDAENDEVFCRASYIYASGDSFWLEAKTEDGQIVRTAEVPITELVSAYNAIPALAPIQV